MHKRLNHVIEENKQFQEYEVRPAALQNFQIHKFLHNVARKKIISELPGSFQNLTDYALAILGTKTKHDLGSW